ncbi:MAG: Asp-tRNA(Asn)/Glu-tRNA(Gln) amidotransferase subunit GatA [Christensenellales bacterium]|jgi:aspartyl-tRNA(Asn)/glutamyl-tRNA(Gln) amidotransferase subunit A
MDIRDYTVAELSALLAKKELTSTEITTAYLSAIEQEDGRVCSYITVTKERALKEAAAADERRARNAPLSPLDGIPYALKDNFCTEGIKTTCASRMLENFVPPYTATAAKKLEEAGCVLLGKLNMDEFAMGSSTENSHFFQTKNPVDPECVPGGSSGGSAAAVAARLAPFALGTDTGGSIRQPASFCGIVGMKPTYGRVSRFGVVAFASSLDQVGPMTRTVYDNALILSVIAGRDPMDASSLPHDVPDYAACATPQSLDGMRIGLPEELMGAGISPAIREAILKAAEALREKGAVVEPCSLPRAEYALPAYYIISSAEAASNLGRYDGIRFGYAAKDAESLSELYTKSRSEGFGWEVKRRIMLGTFALSSGYYDAYYKRAQQARTLIMQDYDEAFKKFDCLLTPVSPVTAWKFGEMSKDPLEMYAADICTVSVNVAGLCGMSVPCGTDENGLPIGAQFIAKPLCEETLYRAGAALYGR